MRQIFKDSFLQEKFERDGYVKLPSFISSAQISELAGLREQIKAEYRSDEQFYTIINSGKPDLMKKVSSAVKLHLGNNSLHYLLNYEPIVGSMFIKSPGSKSEKDVHQDISYTDERLHITLTIWAPLTDVNIQNGCMCMLKGSHRLSRNIRYLPSGTWEYEDVKDQLLDFLTPEPMQAGDALIYNTALVHASKPNLSDTERIAIAMTLNPAEAELFYYCKNADTPGNRVMKYRITPDFFLGDYKNRQITQEPDEVIEYVVKKVSKNDLTNFIREKNN